MSERHRERERADDYRAGVVASMCSAMWRKKALEPKDFFVSLRTGAGAAAAVRGPVQTPEQQLAIFRHVMGDRVRMVEG